MKVATMLYTKENGWEPQEFPDMDTENTLVLIFADTEYTSNSKPILELARKFLKATIIGCSSAGEIYGDSAKENTISVAIIKFEKTKIKSCSAELDENISKEIGHKVYQQLYTQELRSIFVLANGLLINGSQLSDGLNENKKKNIIITGGMAGGSQEVNSTWIVEKNQIKIKKVVAVGLYGCNINIGIGSKGGWDIFGPERIVTRSEGNVLYELDGKPALQLYKEYLGEMAKDLPASGLLFPLSIRKNSTDSDYIVRTITSVDEQNQALIFAGDIPQGYTAQLMRANFDKLIDGATQAGEMALTEQVKNKKIYGDVLLVAISCVGRKELLGERTTEEVETVLEIFPHGTHQVGFYSFGEFSTDGFHNCNLHNQTMTLTSLSEVEE